MTFAVTRLMPVSYTHLDVYKRQEQISEYNVILKSEAELKKRRAAVTEQNKLYDSITEFIRPQLCDLEKDVYKRQLLLSFVSLSRKK